MNRHTATVRLLISKGADIMIPNNDGNIALHLACQNGHQEIAYLLLNASTQNNSTTNLDICNITGERGDSPLHFACCAGNISVINLLISCGVNINSRNDDQVLPLHFSAYYNHIDNITPLLLHGADSGESDHIGTNILHIACEKGHFELL
jgi:ankyrin repeat protein